VGFLSFLIESVLEQHSALKSAPGTIFVGTAFIGGRFCVTGTVPKVPFRSGSVGKVCFAVRNSAVRPEPRTCVRWERVIPQQG